MGKFSREQYEVTQYLANLVGRSKANRFMRDISCMSQEWRQVSGLIEIAKRLSLKDGLTKQEENDLDQLKEVSEILGQAEWSMDIISHLAMKAGKVESRGDG